MAFPGAIRAGRAFVELFADSSKLVRDLKSAQRLITNFGQTVRDIGIRLTAASAAMGAPLVAGIKAAGDAMETLNKFEQVFGNQARAAGDFADAIAREVGRSRYEIRDAFSSLQAFFVGLEFPPDQARQMSEQVERLALDFASLYNLADPEAMDKFQAGLAGMSRPLREYGVNLLDSAVSQELMRMGLAGNTQEATEQQKVLARLSIIMRALTDQGVVGDAVRTAGSFANRMKALKGQLRDTAVEIGNALLPVVTPLLSKVVDVVKVVGQWVKQNKKAVVTFAKVVALVGAAGVAMIALGTAMASLGWTLSRIGMLIGIVGKGFGLLKSVIGLVIGMGPTLLSLLAAALTALLSPIGLVVAAITAVGVGLLWATGAGGKALAWLGGQFKSLKDAVASVFRGIRDDALKAFDGIKDALAAGDIGLAARILWLTLKMEWQKGITPLLKAWHKLLFGIKAAWEIVTYKIIESWHSVTYALKVAWAAFANWWKTSQAKLSGWLAKRMLEVQGVFDKTLDVEFAKRQVDVSVRADLASLDREYGERLGRLRSGHDAATAFSREEHERRLAQISEEHDERIAATRDALSKARKDWEEALAEAKRKREEAELAGPEVPGKPGLNLRDLLSGVTGAVAERAASVAGTFSAMAVWGLGGGGPLERTARASEETAKNTKRLLEEAQVGGLTFA